MDVHLTVQRRFQRGVDAALRHPLPNQRMAYRFGHGDKMGVPASRRHFHPTGPGIGEQVRVIVPQDAVHRRDERNARQLARREPRKKVRLDAVRMDDGRTLTAKQFLQAAQQPRIKTPVFQHLDRDPALALRAITVNYIGAVNLLQVAAPIFEAQRRGRIVALGSVAGDRGRLKNYVYGSAKAGLSVYLQGLRARLYRSGVTVTTVKPGFVDTAMTFGLPGLFLVASPESVARACLKAAKAGREELYVPFFWWGIMTIIRNIPERLFKRLNI